MKIFTSHFRAGQDPLLLKEGFSWWATIFGPLWFLVQRAWIPAALDLAASLLLIQLSHSTGHGAPLLGYIALRGFLARDAVRWGLARRGFAPGPVVAATDGDAALARLLTYQAGRG